MKIRNGFVSNSSSSSYVIAIAKVKDDEYIKEKIKKININTEDEYSVGFGCDSVKNLRASGCVNTEDNYIRVASFNSDCVLIKLDNMSEEDLILFLWYFGNEGDSRFWDDDFFEMKSIHSLDWFNGEKEYLSDAINVFREGDGLEEVKIRFGVDRNE